MMTFAEWLRQLQFGGVADTVLVVLAALLCITIHETSHGLVACWLGDPTARDEGRLTLNPIRHIDIFGLIMMAVFKFGWAKPVPVDMRYFKHPKQGMALTALAGPVSNLVLAFAALVIRAALILGLYRFGWSAAMEYVLAFVENVAVISVGLAVFNIIPISPLDGSKVLFSFLPDRAYALILRYERFGFLILMALLFTGVLDYPLVAARSVLLNGMNSLAVLPFSPLMM